MRANAPFEPERGQYRPAGAMPTQSSSSYYSGPFGWWFRLSVPPEPPASADFATRDRARRGRLAGSLLFGLLLLMIVAVPISWADPTSRVSAIVGVAAVVLAVILNRRGFVNVAGVIMVALPALVIASSITAGDVPTNKPAEAFFYLPLLSLLALSEVIAASLLAPIGVLIVMLVIIGFTVSDLLLQLQYYPALTPYFQTTDGRLQLFALPIAFQLIVGVIGFLWARSTVQSIRRADRAEELAELERRELERTHELEEGVRQLLAVHVHLANGDFNVRAPAIRNSLLWQIGSSLNNLVARLGRLAQAEFVLRRTQEEANRVTEAIYMINSGRQPIWPGPSNTPLDRLVDVLRSSLAPRGAGGAGGGAVPGGPQAPQLPSSATGAYPGAPGMGMNQQPSIAPGMPMPGMPMPGSMMGAIPDRSPSPTGYPGSAPVPNSMNNPNMPNTPNGPNNPVPDWMRPLMPADGSGASGASGGAGQPQRPPVDVSRSPISGPGAGPASGFGAPAQQQHSPQSDVNPWSLEPGEPLDDVDLPEWLRQPNQE